MLADSRVNATVPTTDLERAREFYEGRLGLRPTDLALRGREMVYECGGATRLLVYERPTAGTAAHTLVHFIVDDLPATVAQLRARGVEFEEYERPDLRTRDGIADFGAFQAAWFKDPDGNILAINSAH